MYVFLILLVCYIVSNQDRSVYCEDWGEGLTNKSIPVICVVNLQSGSMSVLQGVPPDVSPGQVRTQRLSATSSDTASFDF